MREQQDATNRSQNIPPPHLGRKYIRKLLEAFESHQDTMVADLDRQIEESDPDIVSRQSEKVSKQWQAKMKQLEQGTDGRIEEATLIELLKEIEAIDETQRTLREQLLSTKRRNSILKYKREHLVELLQAIHTIQQEGHWEKIGEKEKYPSEFSLLGERFLTFEFTKQRLRLQTIEDIHEWMKQRRPDCVPVAEEPEEPAGTTKKLAKPTQRKRPIETKQSMSSASPAEAYERQAWIRLLVSAHHYSSYFQDSVGELGVFVYDKVEGKPQAMLHLWANGAKQQFPVVNGTISKQEALTDTMGAWLAMCWVAATGEVGEDKPSNTTRKKRGDQTDEK